MVHYITICGRIQWGVIEGGLSGENSRRALASSTAAADQWTVSRWFIYLQRPYSIRPQRSEPLVLSGTIDCAATVALRNPASMQRKVGGRFLVINVNPRCSEPINLCLEIIDLQGYNDIAVLHLGLSRSLDELNDLTALTCKKREPKAEFRYFPYHRCAMPDRRFIRTAVPCLGPQRISRYDQASQSQAPSSFSELGS